MMSFTDINTGDTILLPNNSVQEAFEGDGLCRLISITGVAYDVSDSWAYVLSELSGGGPPI